MKEILHLDSANDYALDVGGKVLHPKVSVIHFDELGPIRHSLNRLGVYAIFVQDNFPEGLAYGMGGYDITKGSLTAVSPGQIIGKADNGHREIYHGWALFFDPDFMHGSAFEENLPDYHFFSYNVNEALAVTKEEKARVWQLMEQIREDLSGEGRTALNDKVVQDYIILICDYCRLFYERQFREAKAQRNDLLSRFQSILNDYYAKGLQNSNGLPNVKYCASELCLSPGYFGDLIRGLMGESPNSVIQRFILDRAKSLLVSGRIITQVSDELGFEYPQHFTRFFKKQTGMLPSKYLSSLNNPQIG